MIGYAPQFIAPSEHQALFERCQNELDWQQLNIRMFGKSIPQPRLTCAFGSRSYTYSGLTLQQRQPPQLLSELQSRIELQCELSFNTVLGNLYRDGEDYMGWHQDNEPELGDQPVIASLTLGERRKFVFKHKQAKQKVEYWLEPGSLLVMAGATQHYWQHALPKSKRITKPRINFTFRRIID